MTTTIDPHLLRLAAQKADVEHCAQFIVRLHGYVMIVREVPEHGEVVGRVGPRKEQQ